MPLKTINSVENKNKLVKEFIQNREILKQRLIDKKIGEQNLQEATEKIYQPVTKTPDKAQKKTDEKQD